MNVLMLLDALSRAVSAVFSGECCIDFELDNHALLCWMRLARSFAILFMCQKLLGGFMELYSYTALNS